MKYRKLSAGGHARPIGRYSKKQGFMTSEVFVAVALSVLILTAALYGFSEAKRYSRDNRRISDLKQISNALLLHLDAEGSYPSLCEWSTDPCWRTFLDTYMKSVPTDPINKNTGHCDSEVGCYVYRYCRLGEGKAFALITNLERAQKSSAKNNPLCSLGGPNQYWVTN